LVFELEGDSFSTNITVGDKRQDVVRMALFMPLWLQIFSPGVSEPFSEARLFVRAFYIGHRGTARIDQDHLVVLKDLINISL